MMPDMMALPAPAASPNGNGFDQGMALMPSFPRPPTPEQIVKMVDQHEVDVQPLRDRMESDYELYRLTDHVNTDPVSGESLMDYAVYTSNEPRNFANKVIAWLAQAQLMIRVEHINDRTHPKEVDNLKERLFLGLLRAADERLVRMLQPKLRNQLSFFVSVRGGMLSGRCLLAKRPDGSTYADVAPWDSMNVHWGVGADGLEWACYKIKKTRQQIQDEYGISVGQQPFQMDGSTDVEREGFDVYDFYNGWINTVVTAREVLKPPTPHGSVRVPVYMILVGNMPMIQPMATANVIKDIGESVYESVRNIYSKYNDLMSIVLELVARSRKPPVTITSADGKKTLPQDPYVTGSEVSLRPEEKVEAMKLLEMAKDTSLYLQVVLGEIQRGTLPHTVYGELAFQLSGYAINTLSQGIETVLSTRLDAVEQAYLQIGNLLTDQYQTGYFDAMQLSGMESNRKYFSQTIAPEMIANSCDYTVKLVSQLPQDDMTKYGIAQIAKEFFARPWIKDNILGIQDSEQTENQFMLQKAQEVLPEAGLFTLMKAAEDQGHPELASFYYQELLQILAAKMGILPPQQGGPGLGGGSAPGRGTPGQRPEVQPEAARGTPPSPATSNSGPGMIAPGTPRPGAQGQQA